MFVSEIISKEEFKSEMKRNDFIITPEGEVVCAFCSGDCGQCGAGKHMNRCQEYVNANKETFVREAPRWVKIILLIAVVMAVILEASWWLSWR